MVHQPSTKLRTRSHTERRCEDSQLALDVADANAEWRTLATTRACLERGGVQRAHLLFPYRQRKETDQIAAQITDIQGQLKGVQEQNRYVQMLSAAKTNQTNRRLIVAASARDSCLKQVWDHVRKLNEWAAEAREIINGKSLPSPGQCGSLDV
ncbi:hypothetical protein CNMCM8980_006105 [Aspergillus fumigatiaffinis]|uniref:Uncharacterized protein n=1 Tax=Aspergillus fumigatiaffinis TaxID=340414 RepID=A0A8H4GQ24_9EURO|nr:hypothetical protein CNMCM6805_005284 [Aspergillus fumigatiaffinis]KAF4229864.1 hypothetical protein CNMCM8980_006105 [Aspergillus fumigatiaffinis]